MVRAMDEREMVNLELAGLREKRETIDLLSRDTN